MATEGSGVEAQVVVELVVLPGEARSFGPGECDMTSATAAAVAKPVVEVRPKEQCPDRISMRSVSR